MHVRVVSTYTDPAQLDELIRLWQELVAPSAVKQPGFRGARLLVNRVSGRVTSIGAWATEADFINSVEWNRRLVDQFASFFVVMPVVEDYELAAEAK